MSEPLKAGLTATRHVDIDRDRTIRAPRGPERTCQGWIQEAALRMLILVSQLSPRPALAAKFREVEHHLLDGCAGDFDLAHVVGSDARGLGQFECAVAAFERRCAAIGHRIEPHD